MPCARPARPTAATASRSSMRRYGSVARFSARNTPTRSPRPPRSRSRASARPAQRPKPSHLRPCRAATVDSAAAGPYVAAQSSRLRRPGRHVVTRTSAFPRKPASGPDSGRFPGRRESRERYRNRARGPGRASGGSGFPVMTLWLALALMTAAAIFAVLWPLGRDRTAVASGHDVAVYRDQLEEIDRDLAEGTIGAAEAEAARVEVS